MPSYLITGVSRGLGWEFLRQISQDPSNTAIGTVRDKTTTDRKVSEELSARSNIHILQADITDYDALKKAAVDTAAITGGSLDYLVVNAAYISYFDEFANLGELGNKPAELDAELTTYLRTNVVANVHVINVFMPLILRGGVRKVIALASGHADADFVAGYDVDVAPLYAISKAALNVAVAKFAARYRRDGVLVMSISPGIVDVGRAGGVELTADQMQVAEAFGQKVLRYEPQFKGPTKPESAVRDVIAVWEKASIENGDSGTFVSHYGNKRWV
ncbi:hypothetical protein GGR56DRAFT_680336 [Xylariaceae sp. FL0804]|nr:hypothetical protein GGR56DRAFT_680336 [Xylariaceae sp. FL0804]